MKLINVGLKYTTAPLKVREKLAFSPEQTLDFLSRLPEKVAEAALLSTCNRTEIYAIVDEQGEQAYQRLISWLVSNRGLSLEGLSSYFYRYQDEEVIRHLFWVTSGLDSMVFGEEQIQGQVKRALELSLQAASSKQYLSFLLKKALRVGKRLRRETELGSLRVSVGSLALEVAIRKFGGLKGRCLLVISAGKTAQLVGKIACSNKLAQILITNRTFSRAQELAEKLGGQAIPFDQLPQALTLADITISATSSPEPIVTVELLRNVLASRNHRPILLLDLAVPRDIDPGVRELDGVELYNLDDLHQEIKSEEDRMRVIKQAEAIIEEEVRGVLNWWRLQEVVPLIKALRGKAEQIRLRELNKTLKKFNLSEEQKSQLDILTRSLANKLLHYPTIKLKEKPEWAALIKEIFALDR